jgi:hypothetical protein
VTPGLISGFSAVVLLLLAVPLAVAGPKLEPLEKLWVDHMLAQLPQLSS